MTAIVIFGLVRANPDLNPAPAAYVEAACTAFGHLSAATDALDEAVAREAGTDDGTEAADRAEAEALAANEAIDELPDWPPGQRLNERLADLLISILNGVASSRGEEMELARTDAADADALRDDTLHRFEDGSLGFGCEAT